MLSTLIYLEVRQNSSKHKSGDCHRQNRDADKGEMSSSCCSRMYNSRNK